MKRDWNIIENILSHFETEDISEYVSKMGFVSDLKVSEDVYIGHIEMLSDAGIIKHCVIVRDSTGQFTQYSVSGAFISMQGHDLLDAIRNKKMWTQIKAKAVRSGLSLSWEFIKAAIPIVIKELLANDGKM